MNFAEYIKRYNPFGFVDEQRVPRHFKERRELYEYTIRRLYEDYPAGIIDPVTFLQKETQMPLRDCCNVVKRNCEALEDGFLRAGKGCFVAWMYLTHLFCCYHTISQTKFDRVEFDIAFNRCSELFTEDVPKS